MPSLFGTPSIQAPGSYNRNNVGQLASAPPSFYSPYHGFGNSIPAGMHATKYTVGTPGAGYGGLTSGLHANFLGGKPIFGAGTGGFGAGGTGGGAGGSGSGSGSNPFSGFPGPPKPSNWNASTSIPLKQLESMYLPKGVVDAVTHGNYNANIRAASPQQRFEGRATGGGSGSVMDQGNLVQMDMIDPLQQAAETMGMAPIEAALARYQFATPGYAAQAREVLGLGDVAADRDDQRMQNWYTQLGQLGPLLTRLASQQGAGLFA